MLAVSVEAFAAYQRSEAWTWEHMALARARPVFGSADARQSVASLIGEILTMPRDRAKVVADAVRMRAEMARTNRRPARSTSSLAPGGLVDLEFAVHVLQLTTGQGSIRGSKSRSRSSPPPA